MLWFYSEHVYNEDFDFVKLFLSALVLGWFFLVVMVAAALVFFCFLISLHPQQLSETYR